MKIKMAGAVAVVFAALASFGVETNGVVASQLPVLKGLFGARFGENIASDQKSVVTGAEGLAVEYAPKRNFLGFSSYTKFATPETRQVFHIRASRTVMPGEVDDVMARAIRMIEFRYEAKAVLKDDNSRAVLFDGGDRILVSSRHDRVFIDAYSDRLLAVARREIAAARLQADRTRFEKDLSALRMELTVEPAGETSRPTGIASVLGYRFGDALASVDAAKALSDGSWCVEQRGGAPFVGSKCFMAFGSTRTKSIYRVRIFWSDCDEADKFDEIRRAVELTLSTTMVESGKDSCRVELGNVLVTMYRDTAKNSIALDFSDKTVYARHLEEAKDLPNDGSWHDIEAL